MIEANKRRMAAALYGMRGLGPCSVRLNAVRRLLARRTATIHAWSVDTRRRATMLVSISHVCAGRCRHVVIDDG